MDEQLESKLDREGSKIDAGVQAGATSVDPKTGKVVALYGGEDYIKHYISNATRQDYQPASAVAAGAPSALENPSTTPSRNPIGLSTVRRDQQAAPSAATPRSTRRTTPPPAPASRQGPEHLGNSAFAQMSADVTPAKATETARALGVPYKHVAERPAAAAAPDASTWTAPYTTLTTTAAGRPRHRLRRTATAR
ncbi:penicillin-binding protein [Streptomyces californicus]